MWKQRIIKKLLGKYEKSRAYQKQEVQAKKIAITPRQIGTYNNEDYDHKSALFEDLKTLSDLGLVDYEWMPYEEDNLIKRIWLSQDPEALEGAYAYVGRKVTFKRNFDMFDWLKNLEFSYYEWMEDFRHDLLAAFSKSGKYGKHLFQSVDQSKLFLECLVAVDQLKGEVIHERILSVQVFNDSKAFQKLYKAKLVSLLKKYVVDLDDSDPLAWVGIRTNPECLQFSGNIKLTLSTGVFDVGMFTHGAVLLARDVTQLVSVRSSQVKGVVFVENQASYESLIEQRPHDWLVVYHGGFASRAKRVFFEKLYLAFPEAVYYHWSDVDLGGVRIFESLERVIPNLKPLLMGLDVLNRYLDQAMRFQTTYRDKLLKYRQKPVTPQVATLLDGMLACGHRLEQEHIPVQEVLEVLKS